jgi:CheY-like chemotaxis protein/HPt (histidine-containing phosphotransfer) domain-containing protein
MQPLEKNRSNRNQLERILVIDDDPLFLRLYRHLLTTHHQSYELVECTDGYVALARMLELTPRLVLLDLTMPRFDGLGFLQVVKSKPELGSLPIIVISSNADEAHARVGELENVRWCSKPIRIQTLKQMLDMELGSCEGTTEDIPRDRIDAHTDGFDPTQLDDYVGPDRSAQSTIAHQFCALSADRLAVLERLIIAPDRPSLRTLAHVLEGSAATLGASRLLAECRRLRASLDAGGNEDDIRQETIALISALRHFTVTLARHFELTDF